jgi:Sigma-70 factor, region 1.1
MANAARAEEQSAQQVEAPEKDSPLLDLSDAAVKKFIETAKARGYVTYDELNAVLPSKEVSSEQIEDTMSMLSDMGIAVVERTTRRARPLAKRMQAEAVPEPTLDTFSPARHCANGGASAARACHAHRDHG